MANLKEKFSKDFEQSNPKELSFNVEQLENNTRKTKHRIKPSKLIAFSLCSSMVVAVVIVTAQLISASMPSVRIANPYTKKYTYNEIKISESNTFKKLNSFAYPNQTQPYRSQMTEQEENAYSNFSNLTYHSLANSTKTDNMTYCLVGLYSILNELEGAVSRSDLKTRFNDLLGLDVTQRKEFYSKVMSANSFAFDDGTTQLKNAAFFTNKFQRSEEYISYLTDLYCECYQGDLLGNVDKMTEWANEAVKSKGFIDKTFLNVTADTCFVFLSTLYFKQAWLNKYLSSDNVKDNFYLNDGKTIKTTFMQHKYQASRYYDYGDYISVKDRYKGGYASITYLVPKDIDKDIYELTKSRNIFSEDDTYLQKEDNVTYVISMKTPKFNFKNEVNFFDTLSSLGFADMFSDQIDSFGKAFDDPLINGNDYFTYLAQVKQKNEVEFNEEGTVVKSVTVASGSGNATAVHEYKFLDVNLDRPFIYIIKDINDTPIFVGHVDNPTLK